MLDKYEKVQPVFYNYIVSSFKKDKISHAYLIETKNVSYGLDLAISLAKFFLCDGKYDERVCKLIDSNSYSDFTIIDCDNGIKKEDIIQLKSNFSLKSNGKRQVYLIKDAAMLNKSSANSLLKFLEEPEEGIIAILLVSNVDKVLDTIRSRCQIINLVNDEVFDYKTIFSYYDENCNVDYNQFIDDETGSFFDFYCNLENSSYDFLVNYNCYDFTNRIRPLLLFGFYLYVDLLNKKLDIDKKTLPDFDMNVLVQNNEISDIIKKIDIINDFLYKSLYNVNLNLFMDNFVISMKGVK